MAEIWSTNRYILLILSFTFPDGVSQKIFNYMKEAEYEDSRKEHMMDCVLYRVEAKIGKIIKDLFKYLLKNPKKYISNELFKKDKKERVIADFIAGMTDRYAINLHKKIK